MRGASAQIRLPMCCMGTNTLLAHEVGAGKGFWMAASAMELKTSGLVSEKSFGAQPFDRFHGPAGFYALTPMQAAGYQQEDFEDGNQILCENCDR